MNYAEKSLVLFCLGVITTSSLITVIKLVEINDKLNLKTGKIQCMYGLEDKAIKACVVDGKLINFADD